jgi:hypothetical protein
LRKGDAEIAANLPSKDLQGFPERREYPACRESLAYLESLASRGFPVFLEYLVRLEQPDKRDRQVELVPRDREDLEIRDLLDRQVEPAPRDREGLEIRDPLDRQVKPALQDREDLGIQGLRDRQVEWVPQDPPEEGQVRLGRLGRQDHVVSETLAPQDRRVERALRDLEDLGIQDLLAQRVQRAPPELLDLQGQRVLLVPLELLDLPEQPVPQVSLDLPAQQVRQDQQVCPGALDQRAQQVPQVSLDLPAPLELLDLLAPLELLDLPAQPVPQVSLDRQA